MNKKNAGYRLFGFMFTLFRVFPVDRNKTFLIATHDDSPEGNIAIAAKAIKKARPSMRFVHFTKNDKPSRVFSFFMGKAYHMATSGVILLDNTFMPMAYTPISKKTVVIQLWHGTGTIKKFGQDTDDRDIARIARRGNKRLTWLIVNSQKTKRQYAGAFGIDEKRIRTTGLPVTDLMLDADIMEEKRRRFFRYLRGKISDPDRKKYVLYAPTFRDEQTDRPGLGFDVEKLLSVIGDNVVLLLRFHPHVSENFSKSMSGEIIPKCVRDRVVDVSGYPGVATLLSVSDVLVTDYSSIIFEYALLKRPMIFYAYDLEEFSKHGRGFYEDYLSHVPGTVTKDEEGLQKALADALSRGFDNAENKAKISKFLHDNYRRMDGRAAARVASLALREKITRQSEKNDV